MTIGSQYQAGMLMDDLNRESNKSWNERKIRDRQERIPLAAVWISARLMISWKFGVTGVLRFE